MKGSTNRTKALLSRGSIDIDQQTDRRGYTPLMLAATEGHSAVVRILIQNRANLSISSDEGYTALHHAATGGGRDATASKILIGAGADLEAVDLQAQTPLHIAADRGRSEMIRALIEARSNVNCRTLIGVTLLIMAA
ncbi:unnamed protein product, partial [Ectocarpus sp. 6 AP-2014]